jgi:hypothetical protein
MRALLLVLAGLTVAASLGTPAQATGCQACAFGGLCRPDGASVPCGPTQAGCVPNGGILLFNSVPPNVPTYWTLFARRGNVPGRLQGKLSAFADEGPAMPSVPAFPGRCRNGLCFGRKGRFVGSVTGDRFTGIASYRRGAVCEFDGTLSFGFGTALPNNFVCRNAHGTVTSEGTLHLQGIRLSGCAP